jgi:hypothetical protein
LKSELFFEMKISPSNNILQYILVILCTQKHNVIAVLFFGLDWQQVLNEYSLYEKCSIKINLIVSSLLREMWYWTDIYHLSSESLMHVVFRTTKCLFMVGYLTKFRFKDAEKF